MNLKSEMLEVVGNLWIVYNHIIIVYFLKKTFSAQNELDFMIKGIFIFFIFIITPFNLFPEK